MKFLVPILMLIAGLAGGVGAGLYLKGPKTDAGNTEPVSEVTEPAEKGSDEATEFARLSNQFIVPVVKGAEVAALVVLSVTLEVDAGASEAVYLQEPRLRDRFLQVLFDHANVGGFDAGFTQAGTMSILRNALREAARDVLGSPLHDVLIVDIVRQEA